MTVFKAIFLILTVSIVNSSFIPIDFSSLHNSGNTIIKFRLLPKVEMRLRSPEIVPGGDSQTKISSFGEVVTFNPDIDPRSIMYNSQFRGKHSIGFLRSFQGQQNFSYVETIYEDEIKGFLLPLFEVELPALRTDQLFRCDHALMSIEWSGIQAFVVVFGHIDRQWRIKEGMNGQIVREKGRIKFGYFQFKRFTDSIQIDVEGGRHCTIDRNTSPSQLNQNFTKGFYQLSQVLEKIQSLPIMSNQPQLSEEL